MNFVEYLKKSDVSQNSKAYYMIEFYEMDFMEGIGSKSRWDAQYLEVCQPLFIGQEMKMKMDY